MIRTSCGYQTSEDGCLEAARLSVEAWQNEMKLVASYHIGIERGGQADMAEAASCTAYQQLSEGLPPIRTL